jgi:hypothetical protein
MEEYPHPRAARYCSSVKPCTRPVTMSSIRLMPSAIASFKTAGATTLSTRRRANSRRSSGGNSSARRDTSVATMNEAYLLGSPKQAIHLFLSLYQRRIAAGCAGCCLAWARHVGANPPPKSESTTFRARQQLIFGLRPSFDHRISAFGFQGCRPHARFITQNVTGSPATRCLFPFGGIDNLRTWLARHQQVQNPPVGSTTSSALC